jgi:hypothetical protein
MLKLASFGQRAEHARFRQHFAEGEVGGGQLRAVLG